MWPRTAAWALGLAAAVTTGCARHESPPNAGPPPPAADAGPSAAELAVPGDGERSVDGLVSKLLRPGTGTDRPAPQDLVEIHYTGYTPDGQRFDSSRARNAPAEFEVGTAIKGWSEGLQQMRVGETRRLWVPAALAYGDTPEGKVPKGPLVFDLELLKIYKRPAPPATPTNLTTPPKTARRLPSGLVYDVLAAGDGHAHPRVGEIAEIHYSGWTADGHLFDSSLPRQQTTKLRLGAPGIIEGWNQALAQLVVGEKARFWIPASLGYGKKVVGGPVGPLVYDVELIGIETAPANARK